MYFFAYGVEIINEIWVGKEFDLMEIFVSLGSNGGSVYIHSRCCAGSGHMWKYRSACR